MTDGQNVEAKDAASPDPETVGADGQRPDAVDAPDTVEDQKAKFRAALDAKKASGTNGVGGRTSGKVNGHAHDSAHGHKVFRRKSG